MILNLPFTHISSLLKRTVLHSRERVQTILYRRSALRPVMSAAGPVAHLPRPPAMFGNGFRLQHMPRWMRVSLLGCLALALVLYEIRTSAFQSWLFSHWAASLTYKLGTGSSPRIVFPTTGPLDERLGYTRIPEFERRLQADGYRVAAQMRFSEAAEKLAAWGVLPPYQEPALPGLVIRAESGAPLYDSTLGHGVFRGLDEVPLLLANTVLFVENRRLQEPSDPRQNPVVDWPRFAKAGAFYAGRKLGLSLPLEGGSTLATQLEKFQHSRDGQTRAPLEKLRQMVSASLKIYREGPDTRSARHEVLLRYLNEVPLAAAPGWGEVNGLVDGLRVWFGDRPSEVIQALSTHALTPEKLHAYKHVLALLCAVRAPHYYLAHNHAPLEARVALYTALLQQAGIIDPEFARRLQATPLTLTRGKSGPPARLVLQRKPINYLRTRLGQLLGEPNMYSLDRLHLTVDSTLDADLQQKVEALFDRLSQREFLATHGLIGEHLLGRGDPREMAYSFLLFERTPLGNVARVHADTLDRSFDLNAGMKMELGSTAKLRTLADYLDLMSGLYAELSPRDASALAEQLRVARDPLTRWAAQTLHNQPDLSLEVFLQQALDRKYSASPGEVFFTGGGAQTFANFERDENSRTYTVRDGLIYSVNLVYIRLMRDIVRFHAARLPYDAQAVLSNPADPVRRPLLAEIAAAEATDVLARAYRKFRNLSPHEVEARLLGASAKDLRHLAMFFFAGHAGAGEEALGRWLSSRVGPRSPEELRRLTKAYGNPQLTVADFGFLLNRHPLDVWCAGEVVGKPGITWNELLSRSEGPRRIASAWLFKTRNRHAQDLRLRTRIEQDVFARMTPSWRRLGFPFERLVPSLATAIGSSSDRPDALAELMGIILNDGVRLPTIDARKLRFASGTPYETILEPAPRSGERVMSVAAARILRSVLAGVVKEGTARRAAGAFVDAAGRTTELGGKTGSGDNRYKTFARGGGVIASRPVSRTAAFVFYIGDRYFGVITTSVTGKEAGSYGFTSTLPVALLKLLAPSIEQLPVAPTRIASNTTSRSAIARAMSS